MMYPDSTYDVTCPNCLALVVLVAGRDSVQCEFCKFNFSLDRHLCPVCSTYHHTEEAICLNCGTPLIRACPNCRTSNWSGSHSCRFCKHELNLLSVVGAYHGKSTELRLDQQMKDARALKEIERFSSEKRMAEFESMDEERRERIRSNELERWKREKRMLLFTAVAVGIFIASLIIYALIQGIA